MPNISKVAAKELECVSVFGDDFDTKDGTGKQQITTYLTHKVGLLLKLQTYIHAYLARGNVTVSDRNLRWYL
jgi:hypothetical protein